MIDNTTPHPRVRRLRMNSADRRSRASLAKLERAAKDMKPHAAIMRVRVSARDAVANFKVLVEVIGTREIFGRTEYLVRSSTGSTAWVSPSRLELLPA